MVINILKMGFLPVHIRILPLISYAVPPWCHPPDPWFCKYELPANLSLAPPFLPSPHLTSKLLSSAYTSIPYTKVRIPRYLILHVPNWTHYLPITTHTSSVSLICSMVAQSIPLVTETETSHPRLPLPYLSHLSPDPVFSTKTCESAPLLFLLSLPKFRPHRLSPGLPRGPLAGLPNTLAHSFLESHLQRTTKNNLWNYTLIVWLPHLNPFLVPFCLWQCFLKTVPTSSIGCRIRIS